MTLHSLMLPGLTAAGREVIVARGRRYRLTDGTEATVTALQLGSGKRDAVGASVRFTVGDERGELRFARFCALVVEELPA